MKPYASLRSFTFNDDVHLPLKVVAILSLRMQECLFDANGELKSRSEAVGAARAKLADLDPRLRRWKDERGTPSPDSGPVELVDARVVEAVEKCRAAIEEEFPGYWPRVEASLAVCATLRLAEIDNCTTLFIVGPSSSGKGTVLDMFLDGLNIYRVDKFTPAAFVANTMGKTKEELESIDLLTQIKHQVMLTRELGTMLRGTNDQLKELFKILTNVLDGNRCRQPAVHLPI